MGLTYMSKQSRSSIPSTKKLDHAENIQRASLQNDQTKSIKMQSSSKRTANVSSLGSKRKMHGQAPVSIHSNSNSQMGIKND